MIYTLRNIGVMLPAGVEVLDKLKCLYEVAGTALLKEVHALEEGMIYDYRGYVIKLPAL